MGELTLQLPDWASWPFGSASQTPGSVPFQTVVDFGQNSGGQVFSTLYAFIGADLDMHDGLAFSNRSPAGRCRKGQVA